jgi:hypothetical protein
VSWEHLLPGQKIHIHKDPDNNVSDIKEDAESVAKSERHFDPTREEDLRCGKLIKNKPNHWTYGGMCVGKRQIQLTHIQRAYVILEYVAYSSHFLFFGISNKSHTNFDLSAHF